MKIIDKNTDFYDFYQSIYQDDHFVFDRRDSYNLSRDEFCNSFYAHSYTKYKHKYYFLDNADFKKFILLQVGNWFWLFLLTVTKVDYFEKCKDYTLDLLNKWQDTNKSELIKLSEIEFKTWVKTTEYKRDLNNLNNVKTIENVKADIINNDFEYKQEFNRFYIVKSNGCTYDREERHIPILKNIGISTLVSPEEIYFALEEYFSTKKLSEERTESIGLTDKEKISNHGFDIKTSFRGK